MRDSPTRVMDNLLYEATDVSITFGKVERAEAGWVLVQASVGLEDGMRAPLRTNNATHLELLLRRRRN